MVGFLKKIRQCGLVSSVVFCSIAWGESSFENLAEKVIGKFLVPAISVETLKTKISGGGIVLLDARELEEFEVSHIPSAKYVGYDDFNISSVTKNIPTKAEVVVYCSVGHRSGKIAKKLKRKGYKVYNLKGGIFDWVNKGYVVIDSSGNETTKIHGYNKSWAKRLKKGMVEY